MPMCSQEDFGFLPLPLREGRIKVILSATGESMKRSAINEILGHTRQFFSQHDVHLPPFCQLSPDPMAQA
jgi:hypothetical protein